MEALYKNQGGGDDIIIIFEINKLGVFRGGIQYTEMKINRNYNAFTDLKSF